MEASHPKKRRTGRGNRRARVLEQAARTLNSNGVSQSSLGEIAEALGLTRPALYYYFKDQEDLVFQSYRRSCDILARQLDQARRGGGDVIAILDAFLGGMLDEAESASLSDVAYLRPDQREVIGKLYGALLEQVADLLRQGVRSGELRDAGGVAIAHAIVGLVLALALGKRRWHSQLVPYAELLGVFREVLRFGIAADRGAALAYQPLQLTGAQFSAGQAFDPEALARAKHEALIAAASWLFSQKGINATTLDEVAQKVGVTKKVIYHNVGDKDTLVAECYRRSFRFFDDLADRTRTYRGDRLEALCASWHGLGEASLREDIAPLPPAPGFEAWPESLAGWISNEAVRLQDNYADLYEAAQLDGTSRPINARAAVVLQTRLYRWLPKWIDVGPAVRDAYAREIADFLRIGLRAV